MNAERYNAITYSKKLQSVGVDAKAADVEAEQLQDIINSNISTKQDLELINKDIKQEFELIRKDMINMNFSLRMDFSLRKYMLALKQDIIIKVGFMLFAQASLIIGVLNILLRK